MLPTPLRLIAEAADALEAREKEAGDLRTAVSLLRTKSSHADATFSALVDLLDEQGLIGEKTAFISVCNRDPAHLSTVIKQAFAELNTAPGSGRGVKPAQPAPTLPSKYRF